MKKIWVILAGILFLAAASSGNELSKQDALGNFVAAGYEYRQGHYEVAIGKYEEMIAAGWQSGNVFYNLGNSYFKSGQLGKAILNYERAKRIIPRDSDLRFNERYARGLLKQSEGDVSEDFVQQFFLRYFDSFSQEELVQFIVIILIIWGGLSLLSFYFVWPKQNRRAVHLACVFFLVIVVSGFSIKSERARNAAIIIHDAEARFEPRPEATAHYKLFEGGSVKIIKEEGMWIKVKRADGKLGWFPKESVEMIAIGKKSRFKI